MRAWTAEGVAKSARWKRIYVLGASAYMAALGFWTLAVFTLSEDGFLRVLAFSATICHAFGIATRNFSIKSLTDAQILAGFLPLSGALALAGGLYPYDDLGGARFRSSSSSRAPASGCGRRCWTKFSRNGQSRSSRANSTRRSTTCRMGLACSMRRQLAGEQRPDRQHAWRAGAGAAAGANIKVLLRLLTRIGAITRERPRNSARRPTRDARAPPIIRWSPIAPDGRSIEINFTAWPTRGGDRHAGHHRAAQRRGGDLSHGVVRSGHRPAESAALRERAFERAARP